MFYSKSVSIFAPSKVRHTSKNKMMTQNKLHTIFSGLSVEWFYDYSNKKLFDALNQKQKPLCWIYTQSNRKRHLEKDAFFRSLTYWKPNKLTCSLIRIEHSAFNRDCVSSILTASTNGRASQLVVAAVLTRAGQANRWTPKSHSNRE